VSLLTSHFGRLAAATSRLKTYSSMTTLRGLFSSIASLSGCVLLLTSTAEAKTHLKISANTLIAESFGKWTAEKPWEQIDHFTGPQANRPTIDLILELQALKAGGLDFDFELIAVPNYERAKIEVIQGNADLAAETIWDDEISANTASLLKTDPIIRSGEFEKGVYVLPTNEPLLKVKSLADLQPYVAATVSNWALDVKTVDAMKVKGHEKVGKLENVFLMIDKKRVDFTLQEFSANADFSIENSGVKLIPIPNCKVGLAGSRSWVVAKTSPHAKEIHEALVRGAKILRDDGRIEKAFKESGFFNAQVANWKRLF
jgi:hypothetical protein